MAEELDLSEEQVQAALENINAHREEVEAQYEAILKRVGQPNPDWVEAGSAKTWDELRRRIDAASLLFKVRVLGDELRQREQPQDAQRPRALSTHTS